MKETLRERMLKAIVDAYWSNAGGRTGDPQMLEALIDAAVRVAKENEQHGAVVAPPVE